MPSHGRCSSTPASEKFCRWAARVVARFEIEDLRENDEYRFVSERADNATKKYGVESVSLLAVES